MLTVEVLVHTATVWTVNEKRPPMTVVARVHNAPEVLNEVALASTLTRARPTPGSHPLHSVERRLSDPEVAELAAVVDTYWPWPAVLFVMGVAGFGLVWAGMAWSDPSQWYLWIVVALCIAGNVELVRRMAHTARIRAQLLRDLAGGVVTLTRYPAMTEEGPMLSPPIERLPQSGFVWTLDGRPAAWRHVPVDRSR